MFIVGTYRFAGHCNELLTTNPIGVLFAYFINRGQLMFLSVKKPTYYSSMLALILLRI